MTSSTRMWAGDNEGTFGESGTVLASQVVVGGVEAGWAGAIVEDLLIYSGTPRVGSCEPAGVECVDADECALGTDICNSNAACTNTVGSYTC
eukprot:2141875-Rhodomonas_salina.1